MTAYIASDAATNQKCPSHRNSSFQKSETEEGIMKGQGCNRQLARWAGRMTVGTAVTRHSMWSLLALVSVFLVSTQAKLLAQASITTFASGGANAKFDGIGVAVNDLGDVYTTGSTPVSVATTAGTTVQWFPGVLKLNASGNALLVEGNQNDSSPHVGTDVCGKPATDIKPTDMGGVAVDDTGTLYSAMAGGAPPVLRITNGSVECLYWGQSGGVPQYAQDVVLDNSGNVYFISQNTLTNQYGVYKVASSGAGTPSVFAETANLGCSLTHPYGLAMNIRTGNLYIADAGCNVIWKVTPAGIITRYAGNSNFVANPDPTSLAGDGGPATNAYIKEPRGVAVDAYGNLYIADFADNRIRKVDSAGIITTVAGTGVAGYAGDNGDPTKAELNGPWGIAVGPGGKIYVGDSANGAVRLITPAGAQMISPLPGSTVPEVVTFSWTALSGATSYQLDVSHNINPIGQGDIVNVANGIIPGTSLQTKIPCDGKTIYVQLSTDIGGAWTAPVSYTYTAAQLWISMEVNPIQLPKQGGAVTVLAMVGTVPLAPGELVELTVTQYAVPRWPCIRAGCPVPIVIGTTSLPQALEPLRSWFNVNIPSLPWLDPYQQYIFSATVSSSSGEALATASSVLIQN